MEEIKGPRTEPWAWYSNFGDWGENGELAKEIEKKWPVKRRPRDDGILKAK